MKVYYGREDEALIEVDFLGIIDIAGQPMAVIRKMGMDLRAVPICNIHFTKGGE